MKKLTSSITICMLCASYALAQNSQSTIARKITRNDNVAKVMTTQHFNLLFSHQQNDSENPDGKKLWEDFSKFTAGSENTPDTTPVADGDGNIATEYTQIPGWTAEGVYQAGGSAYMNYLDDGWTTAILNTPSIDLTANEGAFSVKFRAKSQSANGDLVYITNLKPGDRYAISVAKANITNEWQEYQVQLDKGQENSIIQFYSDSYEWFLDDIIVFSKGISAPENVHVTSYKGTEATIEWNAVENATAYIYNIFTFNLSTLQNEYILQNQSTSETKAKITDLDPQQTYFIEVAVQIDKQQSPFCKPIMIRPCLPIPQPESPTDYNGTQFTAKWTAVKEADSYLLKVFHLDNSSKITDIEQELNDTSHLVTNLNPDIIYSFTVQAKNLEGESSLPSKEMKVLPIISTPTAMPATEITPNSFVANWEAVDGANIYETNVYKEHTALSDETYILADAKLNIFKSTGTLENPERLNQPISLSAETGGFDWYLSMAAVMQGGVGLDNAFGSILGPAFMYSPALNLNPFNGKASFDITLASADGTKAAISLAYANSNNILTEIETFEVPVTSSMTKHHVNFTKGDLSDIVYVLVYPKDGSFLMFQDFRLSIEMPKDSKIEMPYNRSVTQTETFCKFENISISSTDRISYDVTAAFIKDDNQVISEPSNRIYVDFLSSISPIKQQIKFKTYLSGSLLTVENPEGAAVEVYNMAGVKVFADNSGEAVVRTQLDMRGAYIVKVGNAAVKVMR